MAPLALRLHVLAIAGVFLLAAACSARSPQPPVAIDCTAENAYEKWVFENYSSGSTYGWYAYGDLTPGGDAGANGVAIEDGGVPCPGVSPYALLLTSRGFQDWGSGFGTYSIGGYGHMQMDPTVCALDPDAGITICPIDGGAWEGVRFWARSLDPSGAPTTKGITLSINDKDTDPAVPDAGCVNYDAGGIGNGAVVYAPPVGGATGAAGGGGASAVPPADACNNASFGQVVLTTGNWQLYNLPWSSFYQLARPNRRVTGFDPASLAQITIAVPKEAAISLWIDDLGFYRHWLPEAGVEAGQ